MLSAGSALKGHASFDSIELSADHAAFGARLQVAIAIVKEEL